jgi:High potential iron-sulfur protein
MSTFEPGCTRRTFVRGVFVLPALAGLLSANALAEDSKAQKSAVQYQDKPNGDKQCSRCAFFIPGETATANGTCKLVEGVISPSGYCIAFNAK